jgi:hypothetical protein
VDINSGDGDTHFHVTYLLNSINGGTLVDTLEL